MKSKYRLKPGKKHYEGGKLLDEGDVVELTDSRAEGLADRFVLVGAGPKPTPEPTQPLGLADLNWSDAAEAVSKLDAEALDAAEAEERAGKDRKSVHEAIEARRAELTE